MDTGVSTACLFLREMNEDAVAVLDGLGIRNTEVFLTTFSEYGEEYGRVIAARKGKMRARSVHVLNTQFEPQLFGAHPRARADAFAWLDRAMAGAAVFGAEHYTFHGITRLKKNSVPSDVGKLAASLNEICDACAVHGVGLSLENVHWALYNEPGLFRPLKERCPALSGVLDVKQARLSGYPYQMYIKDMEGSISHVHLSDVDERGRICLPGTGVFDFETCLRRLKDAGFAGTALIEVYAGDYGDVSELRRACDYLGELIDKIG